MTTPPRKRCEAPPRRKAARRKNFPANFSILDALDDPQLLGGSLPTEDYTPWRAFFAALFALPMSEAELAVYRECTGRQDRPTTPASEAWLVCGRRAGKSFATALLTVWMACFRNHKLAVGGLGTVPVICPDRRQARVVLGYVRGLLQNSPLLARMVVSDTASGIELDNGVRIEVHTASFRSVRGYTIVGAAILDEVAFMKQADSATPDHELVAALTPAMATTGAILLGLSSPYARKGILWDAYQAHFGQDGDVLVWQAPTRTMNPTVPESVITKAMKKDEASAQAEYNAVFRRDIQAFIAREVLEPIILPNVPETPPGDVGYHAWCDPSGGRSDSMTLAIATAIDGIAHLVCLREALAPFSPEKVVAEFAAVLHSYGLTAVTGDRYGGVWPTEEFNKHGITYDLAPMSASDVYLNALAFITSQRVRLLDHPRLHTQLLALERRTSQAGRDIISHPKSSHDDLAAAACGALWLAAQPCAEHIAATNLATESQRAAVAPTGDTRITEDRLSWVPKYQRELSDRRRALEYELMGLARGKLY